MNRPPIKQCEIAERVGASMEGVEPTFDHAELLYMMHELSRLITNYFDNAMSRYQLTHSQWWALMHILHNEGCTQAELARILQMGSAATGKLLERLEIKEWIERRADSTDSRLRRVYLDTGAVPIFEVMTKEGQPLFNHFLKNISEEEKRSILAGLRKMKANASTRSVVRDRN